MTNKQIGHFLEVHNMTWWEDKGRIYVISFNTSRNGRYTEEVEDLTGYNMKQLKAYMNY